MYNYNQLLLTPALPVFTPQMPQAVFDLAG
jgi:hypothetical protein